MTELQVLLTYLLNLPAFKGQRFDVDKLSKRLNYSLKHKRSDLLISLLEGILSLDDAIVNGLNSHKFEFTHDSFSVYPSSVLPKFLFGLTSRIFDRVSGALLPNYDSDAVEAILTGLRLVRRAKVKGYNSVSTLRAIDEFIEPQVAPEPTINDLDAENIGLFWSFVLADFTPKLGFPGNGVTSDMRFPYVPTMSIVNPFTLPAPIRLPMQEAYARFLPDNYDVTSDTEFIKSYDYVPYPDRIVSLSVVPKSFKVGRGITVTNTSSVIIGATLRESIWDCIKRRGLSRLVNVHNQSLSHEALFSYPDDTFCRDIKGGSTCIRVNTQRRYLSSSRVPLALFNFSIPSAVHSPHGVVDLVTLTMGDSSCTALLSVDMLAFVVIAECYLRHGIRLLTTSEITSVCHDLSKEDRVRCVGDDVLGPSRLASLYDMIAIGQGVKINTRKSSDAGQIHQESCGCWKLRESDGHNRRIYPFRAPNYSNDLVSDLSTAMRSYERTKSSKFSVAIMIAYASVLSHSLEYLSHESYIVSQIGSQLGTRPNRRSVQLRPPNRVGVGDDIAYAFGCRESSVVPRRSKRPVVERGRIVKSRDITRARSILYLSQAKIHRSIYEAPNCRSVSRLTSKLFALSVVFLNLKPSLVVWS